jgi:hypothetical protein
MRKSTLFGALLSLVLFFGALVPQAQAQRWSGRGYGAYAPSYFYAPYSPSYYAPSYYAPSVYAPSYYSTPAYSYYLADPTYSVPATSYYSVPATSYAAPATSYYSAPAASYYYSAPATSHYYGPNYGYGRGGYLRAPLVRVGW